MPNILLSIILTIAGFIPEGSQPLFTVVVHNNSASTYEARLVFALEMDSCKVYEYSNWQKCVNQFSTVLMTNITGHHGDEPILMGVDVKAPDGIKRAYYESTCGEIEVQFNDGDDTRTLSFVGKERARID